jgi:hypothetical protein
MRILRFDMMGVTMTQYIESDEEAARLYGEASQALKSYQPIFRNEGEEAWELVASDGTRQTIRLDKLAIVTLTPPDLPGWLREFHVENERRGLEIKAAAQALVDAGLA